MVADFIALLIQLPSKKDSEDEYNEFLVKLFPILNAWREELKPEHLTPVGH